jgi:hypothetical protein
MESRGWLDASDLDLLNKFRAGRVIDPTLKLGHAIGRTEPVLWVADILCGAVTQKRVGNAKYLDCLGSLIQVVEV